MDAMSKLVNSLTICSNNLWHDCPKIDGIFLHRFPVLTGFVTHNMDVTKM